MKNVRFGLLALILTGVVAAAVAGLVAQTRSEAPTKQRSAEASRDRARWAMFDGRGGQIGVVVRDLDADGLKAALGAPSGVRIDDVHQDRPASKAGIKEGDIVVELDGERVRSARQFSRLIQETADGRSVRLGIVRDGTKQNLDVTPESRPFAFNFDGVGHAFERQLREAEPKLRDLEREFREFRFEGPLNFEWRGLPWMTSPRGRLGVQIGDLTPQLADYFGAKNGGALVSSVTAGTPAASAGLKAGDVIVSINGARVGDLDDLVEALRGQEGEVAIVVLRDKKEVSLKATLEDDRERPRRSGRPA
ncbi:MAG: PDZ domain-containing protein [Acidobacteriota bacterium]